MASLSISNTCSTRHDHRVDGHSDKAHKGSGRRPRQVGARRDLAKQTSGKKHQLAREGLDQHVEWQVDRQGHVDKKDWSVSKTSEC